MGGGRVDEDAGSGVRRRPPPIPGRRAPAGRRGWPRSRSCPGPSTPSPPPSRPPPPPPPSPRTPPQVTTSWLKPNDVSPSTVAGMGGTAFYYPPNATFYFSYRLDLPDFDDLPDGFSGGTNVYLFTVGAWELGGDGGAGR